MNNMNSKELNEIYDFLSKNTHSSITSCTRFFKTKTGEYAAHDKFFGVSVPTVRKIAQQHRFLSKNDVHSLLNSEYNEIRLLALFILVFQYQNGSPEEKASIYQYYLDNIKQVNNWNLVDSSAHHIIGAHLFAFAPDTTDRLLTALATSDSLWKKRIAIIATLYHIKQHDFKPTLKVTLFLLSDSHDLIHKAVGWMLREVGKKDCTVLKNFLDKHAHTMPRTMLRYAIEKFSANERAAYLAQ